MDWTRMHLIAIMGCTYKIMVNKLNTYYRILFILSTWICTRHIHMPFVLRSTSVYSSNSDAFTCQTRSINTISHLHYFSVFVDLCDAIFSVNTSHNIRVIKVICLVFYTYLNKEICVDAMVIKLWVVSA